MAASVAGQAAAAPDTGPSFSCTGASLSPTETRICGDAELTQYDRELAGLYQSRLSSATPAEKPPLVQGQLAWLQKRNACGDSVDCIKGAYLTRIYDLQTRAAPAAQSDQSDQVNAAVPLSSTAQTALNQTRRRVVNKAVLDEIQSQFTLKLKLRALNCIQSLGIAPGLSRDQIHDSYGGSPCFAKQDDDIASWLGMRTVGYLVTLPPLRPMPATAPLSFTDDIAPVRTVEFAAQAGVAAIETQKDVEVMDLTRSSPISSRFRQNNDGSLLTISPNGRVYITSDYHGLHFYDAEDGTPLGDSNLRLMATNCGFPWLGRETILIRSSDPGFAAEVYDLGSDTSAPLDSQLTNLACVTPLPGEEDTFVGFAGAGMSEFKLVYGNDGKPRADVLQVKQSRGNAVVSTNPGLTADGRKYVAASNGPLLVVDLNNFSIETVDLGGFDARFVVPTADPDKVIVSGNMKHGGSGGSEPAFYVYAIKERTVSLLATGGLRTSQLIYDSPQQTLYELKESTLVRYDELNEGTAVALPRFAQDMADADQTAQANAFVPPGAYRSNGSVKYSAGYSGGSRLSANMPSRFAAPSGEPPPAPDNINQMAQDADVQGIGVFESDTTGAPAAATSVAPGSQAVQVTVWDRKPLILVLSSQVAVAWQLKVTPGAQLTAVLISGPNGASVQGQGSAPVVAIGSAYSYAVGGAGYAELQTEVFNWAGKRMKLLQGGGPTTRFTIY